MKRLLLILLCLLFVSIVSADTDTIEGMATSLTDTYEGVADTVTDTFEGQTVASGGSCDDCSGTIVLAVHFEDTSGNDIETGTPCGCSDGTDKTYSFVSSAAHSSAQYSDGAYSIIAEGENHTVEIDNTGIAAGVSSVGTFCVDYYKSTAGDSRIFTLPTLGRVTDGAGSDDNNLQIDYGSDNKVGTHTFADNTMTRICFSWDESQSPGSDKLAVQVEGNAWEEDTGETLTDPGLSTPLNIISGDWQYGRGYFDNIKIYSTYQAEDNQ